ncbi:MAG: 30S ribosome-binding factor RbfA [Tepidanaerobacteraceae bacterium]|nr:30S ribosome-binding factor RbfA [Tepidanaerobacter sp.]HQA60284.1 30S ribosome-binding factor RbfA [Tepidanaerobacteraceae bacterium]
MEFSRNERIAEEIKKAASLIINNELKDPRIDGLVSVTRVDVTRDLRHATIFISFYGDNAKKNTTFDVIQKAKGFIRYELANQLRIKYMPEISIKLDESIEYGFRIDKLLKDIKSQELSKEGN